MSQSSLPSYGERVEQFRKVRLRILNILYEQSPTKLTSEEIGILHLKRYSHLPKIGNRLRELRNQGLVKSFPSKNGRRLLWGLTEDWKKQ